MKPASCIDRVELLGCLLIDASRSAGRSVEFGAVDYVEDTIRTRADVDLDVVDTPVETDLGRGVGVLGCLFVGAAMTDDFWDRHRNGRGHRGGVASDYKLVSKVGATVGLGKLRIWK